MKLIFLSSYLSNLVLFYVAWYLTWNSKIFVSGTQLVTKSVQGVASSLMNHETPSDWLKLWDGPEDPAQWLKAVTQKTVALGTWLEKVQSNALLANVLDLSQLFHPDTFLNAFRQQTARCDVVCFVIR